MAGNRKLFEDVGTDKTAASRIRQTGGIDKRRRSGRGALRGWLVLLFALVMAMIVVGGLTRLTDSGLSITEWNVVKGAVPPFSDAAWDAEFAKYQAIPEYQLQNKGMSLSEFKSIYWWEWGHRQLGRVIGLVWGGGFLFFWATRRIPPGWSRRLLGIGALGGLQGAIGWWMVSSGLSGSMLDVASYRLATHLGLAFVILGLIAWYVMQLSRPERELMQARRAREPQLQSHATVLMGIAFVQILLGALVAGIDAGRNYIDWPLMAGSFLPPDMWHFTPLWRNFFENDGLVQFVHRMWGYLTFAVGLRVWSVSRRSSYTRTKRAADWMTVMLLGQVVLGIITVMSSAPWHLAILHQIVAVILWVLVIRLRHIAQYPFAQSVRTR